MECFAALAAILKTALKALSWANTVRRAVEFVKSARSWPWYLTIPPAKRDHLRDVRERLGTMPFIYHDVQGTLLSDYVPVSYRSIDLLSLDARRYDPEPRPNERERAEATADLRFMSRALFLADAGMGKTTFLSYVAVAAAQPRTRPIITQLFGTLAPFPVFVPLKVLDNSAPKPIQRYILSLPYFRGKNGLSRLTDLVTGSWLLLLLDGYDEIYVPPDPAEAYIRDEIDALFTSIPSAALTNSLTDAEVTGTFPEPRSGFQAERSTTSRTG